MSDLSYSDYLIKNWWWPNPTWLIMSVAMMKSLYLENAGKKLVQAEHDSLLLLFLNLFYFKKTLKVLCDCECIVWLRLLVLVLFYYLWFVQKFCNCK